MAGVKEEDAYSFFKVTNVFDTHQQDGFKGIPRYLFRVHDQFSTGTTSTTEVCSPAIVALRDEHDYPSSVAKEPTVPTDFSSLNSQQAKDYLNSHLRWTCGLHYTHQQHGPCNLMSWTSSILFALQYALHRHGHGKPNYDSADLSEIKILVVDTTRAITDREGDSVFMRHRFLRDLQAIKGCLPNEKLYGSSGTLEQLHGWRDSGMYYPGEYLSQGRLALDPEHCHEVSLSDLIECGLFEVCPGLSDEDCWASWAKRVNELRLLPLRCCGSTTYDRDVLRDTLGAVVSVARAFGSLAGPVAVHLLGLSRVDPRGEGNARSVLEFFQTSLPDALSDVYAGWTTLGSDRKHLPELEWCKEWYVELSRLMSDVMRMRNEAIMRERLAGRKLAAARESDDEEDEEDKEDDDDVLPGPTTPEHKGPESEAPLDETFAAMKLSETGLQ